MDNSLRAGRIVINLNEVESVKRDAKAKATVVTYKSGRTSTFKKHFQAVWEYFRDNAGDLAE